MERVTGITVLRGTTALKMSGIRPIPVSSAVATPREWGVTSTRNVSTASPFNTAACSAAPSATQRSGSKLFTATSGRCASTSSCTSGMRVEPPTRIARSRSEAWRPASASARSIAVRVSRSNGWISASKSSRCSSVSRCSGVSPWLSRYASRTFTWLCSLSWILARSAACSSRASTASSAGSGTPCSCSNRSASSRCSRRSKSSPPRRLSPWLASTSVTGPEISTIDTSNVPPPRSYTSSRWLSSSRRSNTSAAAVGSFRICSTSSPAISPASFVACRWASVK